MVETNAGLSALLLPVCGLFSVPLALLACLYVVMCFCLSLPVVLPLVWCSIRRRTICWRVRSIPDIAHFVLLAYPRPPVRRDPCVPGRSTLFSFVLFVRFVCLDGVDDSD